MIDNNIENIRKDSIADIKEKIKKNSKYIHPCNKERLCDMKRLGFDSGYSFTCWMQQNGIIKNPADIKRDYNQKWFQSKGFNNANDYRNYRSQKLGYSDDSERIKNWRYNTGRNLPKELNEDCTKYFGEYIAENYIMKTFEDPIPAPQDNPYFDWTCKNGDKIQHKARCLMKTKNGYNFHHIDYNNVANWFVLSDWDNRDSLTPMLVLIFHKNDIVRGDKFWRRDSFWVTNTDVHLKDFERYNATDRLKKLKEKIRLPE